MSKLRKIGRILLLVGGILSLVDTMLVDFLLGVGCIVCAFVVTPMLVESTGLPDVAWIGIFIGVGVVLIFEAIFALVAGVLGIKGFKEHAKGVYVGNIVFSVLTGFQLLLLAGAILGLIALKKEAKAVPAEEAPAE